MSLAKPDKSPAVKVGASIPIVIAAGGLGSRIGGAKHTRLLGGRPLLDRAIGWARAHSKSTAIAVRNGGQIVAQDIPLLPDKRCNIGPISALESAFKFAAMHNQSHVMLVGCDMPFLPDDLLLRLNAAIGTRGCAMPVSAGKDHPMAALWRVDMRLLRDYIDSGGRSLWSFAETATAARVQWGDGPELDPFANINDEAALVEAEKRIKWQSR